MHRLKKYTNQNSENAHKYLFAEKKCLECHYTCLVLGNFSSFFNMLSATSERETTRQPSFARQGRCLRESENCMRRGVPASNPSRQASRYASVRSSSLYVCVSVFMPESRNRTQITRGKRASRLVDSERTGFSGFQNK